MVARASTSADDELIRNIAQAAQPLDMATPDYRPLLDRVGDARFVLIGEASHGTHEFYRARAELTKHLIRDKGFTAVAAEADWPDAWRVNRFVRGSDEDADATDALSGFQRFPQWMWRNADVLDFVGWLRTHNDALRATQHQCGFYGIDLYCLNASIRAVLEYLDRVDHSAATRARYRYSCFDHFGEDPQAYGYAATFGLGKQCMDEVVQQLVDLRSRRDEYIKRDPRESAADEYFYAEQNARMARNAERYYRSMFEGHVSSWNQRDRHMVETIEALVTHADQRNGSPTKVVVWAHNSHLGDARATEMGEQGELNVGQLVRENWGDQAFNIGFSTYAGTVTAADDWDGPAKRKAVREGLPGSYESIFHGVGPQFWLDLRHADAALAEQLRVPRLQRAIGVIYRPQTERASHYFHTRLADQFDAMIHLDQTRAVEPLERVAKVSLEEPAETYPTGM